MKHFFIILFGGLFVILFGIAIAYGGHLVWVKVQPFLSKNFVFSAIFPSMDKVSSTIFAKPIDGTSISGITRTIRYTATEEEDFINSISLSLANSLDQNISAKGYIIKNITTGNTISENNSDKLLPIASITKLATAVIARKLLDPDEKVVITKSIISTYGNTALFSIGETLRVKDIMYPLLMVSSNDAAEALAQDYGKEKFILAMNNWAQSIGAYRTYFADPSGLSAKNISSVNDLVIILDWIIKNDPEIIAITKLTTRTTRAHTWNNPTHFLSWSYYIGGKNGYTTEANRTSASLFSLGTNNNTYAVVVLGSKNRDADIIKLLSKIK